VIDPPPPRSADGRHSAPFSRLLKANFITHHGNDIDANFDFMDYLTRALSTEIADTLDIKVKVGRCQIDGAMPDRRGDARQTPAD
jgi:hypothetical protein